MPRGNSNWRAKALEEVSDDEREQIAVTRHRRGDSPSGRRRRNLKDVAAPLPKCVPDSSNWISVHPSVYPSGLGRRQTFPGIDPAGSKARR